MRSPRLGLTEGIVALVILTLVALFVQWPYRHTPAILDDITCQLELALASTGRASLPRQLLHDYSGTLHPLWKLIYLGRWRLHGDQPLWWHVGNTLMHAAAALAVLVIGRRYMSVPAAWTAALAWAAVAIGRWDNPLCWIWAASFVAGVLGILLAMAALTGIDGRRSWLACLLFTAGLAFGLLNWSITLLLAAAIPLQYWLLERPHMAARPPRFGRWLAIYLVVCGAVAVLQLWAAAGQLSAQSGWSERGPLDWLRHAVPVYVDALAVLVGFDAHGLNTDLWGAKLALAALVLLTVVVVPPPTRRLVLIFHAVALLYLIAINLRPRGGIEEELPRSGGRYAYLLTLAWCFSLGACIQAICNRRRAGRPLRPAQPLAWLAVVALIGYLCLAQRHVAVTAARQFETIWQAHAAQYQDNVDLLVELAAAAPVEGETVRLPRMPIPSPWPPQTYFPLDCLLWLHFHDGLPGIDVVAAGELTTTELDSLRSHLHSTGNEQGNHWLSAATTAWQAERVLRALDELGRIHDTRLLLPNVTLDFDFDELRLGQVLRFQLPDAEFLDVVDPELADVVRLQATADLLREHPSPETQAALRIVEDVLAVRRRRGE